MMYEEENSEKRCCDVWAKFEKIRSYHDMLSLNSDTEMAYRFFEGDQWYGIDSGNESLPIYNFIRPTVNYKVSMVALNSMVINYSAIGKRDEGKERVVKLLNTLALQLWEQLKMDSKCWQAVKAAGIAGDSYVYFYEDRGIKCQHINNTDIFLGDERQPDIQKQPFIIISERINVDDAVRIAKNNKISKEKLEDIIADDNTENLVTTDESDRELKIGNGKCTGLLYLELRPNGDLEFMRCTKYVEYVPKTVIKGLGCYPVASLIFGPRKGSARGRGEVLPLINNQIEVNRSLARRVLNSKLTAYSRLIYASDSVVNPKALGEVGTAIEIEGDMIGNVRNYIDYITPAPMSSESTNLTNEMVSVTRDLAGAGDAAVGNIDPTQTSGTAIIAVRDQAAIPLNEQTAAFKQFVEDIARIWLELARTYNPDGVDIDGELILPEEMERLDLSIQIDVSSKTPYSKYAREQALERLFTMGHISFEEYVNSLDSDGSVPKSVLEKIVSDRAAAIEEQQQREMAQTFENMPGTMRELENKMAAARAARKGVDVNVG